MFHTIVFVLDEQQSSPGRRQILSERVMVSAEPATVTDRRYPLFFQEDETAYGDPIAGGQHPHNLFMEIAALYDVKLEATSLVSFYFAQVGDPAIGLTAYPHRASTWRSRSRRLGITRRTPGTSRTTWSRWISRMASCASRIRISRARARRKPLDYQSSKY